MILKYYEDLLLLGCFSRNDVTDITNNAKTADSLIREYLNKGYIERVRHDLYAVISLETKQPVPNQYQIGCSVFPDAYLSHHSAFEYYGYVNQVFNEIYVASGSRFNDFSYNGYTYHRLTAKKEPLNTGISCIFKLSSRLMPSFDFFDLRIRHSLRSSA